MPKNIAKAPHAMLGICNDIEAISHEVLRSHTYTSANGSYNNNRFPLCSITMTVYGQKLNGRPSG